MYDGRTVGVRVVDDTLLDAVNGGCSQIVLLGAGLDTHAFRLEWPRPVQLFEVDLPALFAFKEKVLATARPHAYCTRHIVSIDLAEDWSRSLVDAGFRPEVPTCWIDHVAVSSPQRLAQHIVREVTDLSCAGSRYSFPIMTVDAIARTADTVPGARELYRGAAPHDTPRGLGADGLGTPQRSRLDSHGKRCQRNRHGLPTSGGYPAWRRERYRHPLAGRHLNLADLWCLEPTLSKGG